MRKPRRESVFIVQLLSFCVQRKKTDDINSSSPKPFFFTSNAQFDRHLMPLHRPPRLLIGAIPSDMTRLLTLVAGAVIGTASKSTTAAATTTTSTAGWLIATVASKMSGFSAVVTSTASAAATTSKSATSTTAISATSVATTASTSTTFGTFSGSVTLAAAIVANHRPTSTSESASTAATPAAPAPLRAFTGDVTGFTATVARSIAHLFVSFSVRLNFNCVLF